MVTSRWHWIKFMKKVPRIASDRSPVRWDRTSSAPSSPALSSEPNLRYWRPFSCPGMDSHRRGNAAAPPRYTSRVNLVSVNTAESSTEGGKGGDKDKGEEDEDDEEKSVWRLEEYEQEGRVDMEGAQVSMRLMGDTDGGSTTSPCSPNIVGPVILSSSWFKSPQIPWAKISETPPERLHAGVTSTSPSSVLAAWQPRCSSWGASSSLPLSIEHTVC